MNTNPDYPDRMLNRVETARMLGISDRTLDRLPDLPRLKLSPSRVGYRLSDVLAWMQSRQRVAA